MAYLYADSKGEHLSNFEQERYVQFSVLVSPTCSEGKHCVGLKEPDVDYVKELPVNKWWRCKDLYEVDVPEWLNDSYYRINLPKGTIKSLIGRDLTWEDEPVEIWTD